MKLRKFVALAFSLALVASSGALALADTLRLRDGSVIRGQIIGYKDQQFTVLIGGARGRRSRITIYAEDVESIEFDNAAAANAGTQQTDDNSAVYDTTNTQPTPADPRPAPTPSRQSPPQSADTGASRNTGGNTSGVSPVFFPIRLRVRA
ncbi:MAG: hypothetical protein LC785_16250, partial [Acidobacteria bacterium]|nr:hypothetical protein [Acidobacteriota bacterium]MCA1636143.1 hypothetical protein [Acidobacteriota bacterium]MCA1643455.1 hypothetical protein [Acidobacteriota bacterium]